jgi:hypothetical protein
MPLRLKLKLAAQLGFGAFIAVCPGARASGEPDPSAVTVVSSKASDDYSRSRLPDGSYKPETYAFGEGGHWTGTVRDGSIDGLKFIDVARAVAVPLARQSYLPGRDPKATRQLIMVYWGRTSTPERFETSTGSQLLQDASAKSAASNSANTQSKIFSDQPVVPPPMEMQCAKFDPATTTDQITGSIDADNAMTSAMALVATEDHNRDLQDAKNASLLGYDAWWDSTAAFKGTPLEHRRQDMIDELEHDRYFVILMAYDFQAMWKQKKHKLLWETRFSVNQRGVEFDKELPLMALNASRYFGQNSNGLARDTLPVGHVDVGDLKTLGVVAEK